MHALQQVSRLSCRSSDTGVVKDRRAVEDLLDDWCLDIERLQRRRDLADETEENHRRQGCRSGSEDVGPGERNSAKSAAAGG